MKKLMSIILTLAMMLSMCVFASAAESNSVSASICGKEVTVQAIDTNRLLVTEDGEKSLIATVYKGNIIKLNNGLPILRRDTAQTRLRAVFL